MCSKAQQKPNSQSPLEPYWLTFLITFVMRLNFVPHDLFYWALNTKPALTLLSHLLLAGRYNLQSRFERKSFPIWRDSQTPRSRMSSISAENGSLCLPTWTKLTVLVTVTSSTTVKVNHDFAQCSVVIGKIFPVSTMKILSGIVLFFLLGSGLSCHFYRHFRESTNPQP